MNLTGRWVGAALAATLLGSGAVESLAAPDHSCPVCHRWTAAEWRYCPFDGTALPSDAAAAPAAPAPAPAPGKAAPPATGPTSPPPVTGPTTATAPAPTTPTASAAAVDAGPIRKLPTETVDDLFAAVVSGDDAALRRCYRWEVFFASTAPEARDAKIADYMTRLRSKVRPSLDDRDRIPGDMRLSASEATLKVSLRDRVSHGIVATYEFTLTRSDDGWKIVAIKP